MIQFLGYSPDLDPSTPGVFTNCSAIVPSAKGFKGAPSPANTSLPALAAQCYGAAMLRQTDDTIRFFAGTLTTLEEGGSTSWTDRSRAGGYSLGATDFWRFAIYNDTSLAAAKSEILQFVTTATNFANVTSTAPKASIVETVNNFVMLLDVDDQGGLYDSLDRPNGWWCGVKGNATGGNWVPSITTECATGTLSSTPGKITAGRRFGQQMVAYKLRSMYLGTYVGQPVIWDWQLIPGEAGALSQEVVVNVGTAEDPKHIIMGFDNFYMFAGGRAVPIGNVTPQGFMSPVKDTVFGELNVQYYYACRASHDVKNALIRFYYPVASQNTPEKCVVYNYRTNRWGRDDRTIEAAVEHLSGSSSYDDLATSYATYNAMEVQSYDTAFISQGTPYPAIFNTSHRIQTLTGAAGSSSITLGDYGDPQLFATLRRLIPRFLTAPSACNFVHFYKDILSSSRTQGETVAIASGRFDLLRSARWHSGRFDITGDHEISGIDADLVLDGEE